MVMMIKEKLKQVIYMCPQNNFFLEEFVWRKMIKL